MRPRTANGACIRVNFLPLRVAFLSPTRKRSLSWPRKTSTVPLLRSYSMSAPIASAIGRSGTNASPLRDVTGGTSETTFTPSTCNDGGCDAATITEAIVEISTVTRTMLRLGRSECFFAM